MTSKNFVDIFFLLSSTPRAPLNAMLRSTPAMSSSKSSIIQLHFNIAFRGVQGGSRLSLSFGPGGWKDGHVEVVVVVVVVVAVWGGGSGSGSSSGGGRCRVEMGGVGLGGGVR